MSYSIIFNKVTKKYKMYKKNSEKLLDILIPDHFGEDFYALQNISFTAKKGDVIGLIGVNGAGKSTLANLIAGIIPPTFGEIEIKGTASLIAIASGLNNNLTGRENIELKCLMLGFSKKQIDELIPDIIDFADIGKFIDQPVKSYSSGMKSRLGFAISVNMDPDILVIDEALSVGDQTFADKCLDKMNEFKQKGKTIFFISHSIGQVKKFCQKALWLEAGEVKAYGTIEEIIPQYENFLKEFKAMSKEDQKNFKQLVIEKRSKLREQERVTNLNEYEGIVPQRHSKKNRKKKKSVFKWLIIPIILLIVILFTVLNTNVLSYFLKEEPEPVTSIIEKPANNDEEVVDDKDIRYINVSKANIRISPDINSIAVGIANFGQSFQVIGTKQDINGDEWLNVITTNLSNDTGWISSKLMSPLESELDDNEIVAKLDVLIDFSPPLEELVPMIGKQIGGEQQFNNVEYLYIDNTVDTVKITINSALSITEVIETIGEPHLKWDNTLLYHGNKYDFVIIMSYTGAIDELRIINFNN